jgi:ankyrin repeat protein
MDNKGFLFIFFSFPLTFVSSEIPYQKKLESNFFHAIKHEDTATLTSYISENKIDINMLDPIEWTPLHIAIVYHKKNIILQLLDAGADINKKTIQGTPLSWGILLNQPEIVRLLIERNVIVTIKDFYQALKQKPCNPEIIKLLGNTLRNNHSHNK